MTIGLYLLWRAPYLEKDYQRNGGYPFGVPQYQKSGDLPTIYKLAGNTIGYVILNPLMITEKKTADNNLTIVNEHRAYFPAGSSTRAWVHWQQMALLKRPFSMFDYGSEELNREKYGTAVPPEYDFGLVRK